MKPVLVGLNNPYSSDPQFALYDEPREGTGYRIFKMIKSVDKSAEAAVYRSRFDRRNLSPDFRPKKVDLIMSARSMKFIPGSTVVLLGRAVQEAFFLQNQSWIEPYYRGGICWRVIPHPSGRCRFYNDPVQRRLVALLLSELYSGAENV